MADYAQLKVKTQTAGDVQVDLTTYLGTALGAGNAVHVRPGSGAVFDVSGSSVAITGAVEVMNDAGNPLPVSGTVAVSGSVAVTGPLTDVQLRAAAVPVDTELPAAAALADDTVNPTVPGVGAFALGWDSGDSKWDRVAVSNSRLQVDVVTGGSPSPTNPVVKAVASSAIAVAGTADLDSDDVGTVTKKIAKIILSSGGAMKAIIKKVSNGAETIIGYLFVEAGGGSEAWQPPSAGYVTQGDTGAGFCGFRVSAFNEDPQIALSAYATFFTEE